mgnify:CR=1 FL=1
MIVVDGYTLLQGHMTSTSNLIRGKQGTDLMHFPSLRKFQKEKCGEIELRSAIKYQILLKKKPPQTLKRLRGACQEGHIGKA